jgi:curved DNA-binding protein
MAQAKDYYAVMGLARNASEKDIKNAYRRLARKYHPDISKEPNAEEKFKELGQAYEVLKDPEKRAAYDKFGQQWEQQKAYEQHQQQQQTHSYQSHGGHGVNIDEDILESLFGYGRRRQGPIQGEDYHANITLTLEEAFQGTTRQIEIPTHSGETQTLSVKIPAGVRPGHKVRLAGQGGPGSNQGPRGSLYLTVHFLKHRIFEVKDKDIYLTLPITPWEAALGATVHVPTLAGVVDLKIPSGSQSGQQLRLKGRGLPGKDGGYQFVMLKVMVPKATTEAGKQLYEKMAAEMYFNPRASMGV